MSALKKALSTLPNTLYETYDRIIQGIESAGQRQDAITALRWLCFSNVPLHLSEIIEVLAIENGDSGGFCPDERLPDPADIMVICSSLISCSDIDEEAYEPRIRLAHFSVKEYLMSDRCRLTSDFQTPICHMAMAEGCLHYLLYLYQNLPMTEDLINQHPLSRYAAKYWWQHAEAVGYALNPTVINLARKLLMNKDAGVLPWIQLYNVDHPWRGSDLSLTIKGVAQPLYYAASMGLLQVVEDIIPQTIDVNARGGFYGNALHAASKSGYEEVVQTLLDAGADINARGRLYGYALQAASVHGHEKVVQKLLNAGADVNAKGGFHDYALRAASFHGYEKVVQKLLNAGADVNAEGRYHSYALHAASGPGHEKMVQILLDAGVDVNAEGGPYRYTLQAASMQGYEKVVQMLLNSGADFSAEGGRYGTALQAASQQGHVKVVQMLLDAGADVSANSTVFS